MPLIYTLNTCFLYRDSIVGVFFLYLGLHFLRICTHRVCLHFSKDYVGIWHSILSFVKPSFEFDACMQLNIMSCDKQARSTYTYRWTKKEAVVFCLYVELTYMKKYSVLGVIKRNFMQLNRETFVNLLRCDAMHSAAIAGTRCPSVCLSRSWVAPKRIKISSKFLHHDCGSQAILVFSYHTGWRYSNGNPLTEASNARVVWKIYDFRPISHSISETVIVRWAHAARQFVSIEFSFHPYNI